MCKRMYTFVAAVLVVLALASCAAPTPTPLPPTATPLPTATPVPPTPTPPPVSTALTLADGVTIEFVSVPAGPFTMGSADGDPDGKTDEKPQHTVTLSAYEIGKYEVTVAQFRAFVAATGYITGNEKQASSAGGAPGERNWQKPDSTEGKGPGNDNAPATYIVWADAAAFCEWASQVTGRTVRLPTEAEWEKAARGTDGRKYPWGDDAPTGELCNFADAKQVGLVEWADATQDDGYAAEAPVGSYPKGASPYGALDMAGNVYEWVSDNYQLKYYAKSPAENPAGPAMGNGRVARGGSFINPSEKARTAARTGADWGYGFCGFRVVLAAK